MTVGGYGQVAFGQCELGQAKSDIEPRYSESFPSDGATNVSIYDRFIRFDVYGFSSRIQADSTLLVEISENAGVSYVSAYETNAFVAPFNGGASRIDVHLSKPNAIIVVLEKTGPWADETEIKVRVTGKDEYGQEATKETPIIWGGP